MFYAFDARLRATSLRVELEDVAHLRRVKWEGEKKKKKRRNLNRTKNVKIRIHFLWSSNRIKPSMNEEKMEMSPGQDQEGWKK